MANLNRELARLQERVDSLYIVSNDELARTVAAVKADAEQAVAAAARVDAHYAVLVDQFAGALAETRRLVAELEDRVNVMDKDVGLFRLLLSKIRGWAGQLWRLIHV